MGTWHLKRERDTFFRGVTPSSEGLERDCREEGRWVCAAQERPLHTCRIKPGVRCHELTHRNVQWFQGVLVLKAHRLCVSHDSRLEGNKVVMKNGRIRSGASWYDGNYGHQYRGYLAH